MNPLFYPKPHLMYPSGFVNISRTFNMYQPSYHGKKHPLAQLPGMNLRVAKLGGGRYAVELVYDWTFPRDARVLTLRTGLRYHRAHALKQRLIAEFNVAG